MTSPNPRKVKAGKGGGAMCGGVTSESTFYSNPDAYMMAFIMTDENFEVYRNIKGEKDRRQFFKKHAYSHI